MALLPRQADLSRLRLRSPSTYGRHAALCARIDARRGSRFPSPVRVARSGLSENAGVASPSSSSCTGRWPPIPNESASPGNSTWRIAPTCAADHCPCCSPGHDVDPVDRFDDAPPSASTGWSPPAPSGRRARFPTPTGRPWGAPPCTTTRGAPRRVDQHLRELLLGQISLAQHRQHVLADVGPAHSDALRTCASGGCENPHPLC
jgi:hypothetical protein